MLENENTNENNLEEITSTTEDQGRDIDLSKFESAEDESVYKVDLSADKEEESKEEETSEEKKLPTVEEVMGIDKEQSEEVEEGEYEDEEYEDEGEEYEDGDSEDLGSVDLNDVPEELVKLYEFLEETGGTLEDYVQLGRDFDSMDDTELLEEYYSRTKDHLTKAEIKFMMEEEFGYDEENDDPNEIRKKQIALKEQVAEARDTLDGLKSDYFDEIGGYVGDAVLTDEQQEAIDFAENYMEESKKYEEKVTQEVDHFTQRTEQLFKSENFKGFEYEVGDKKFRYNVKDVDSVMDVQSDLNNFIRKFLNEDGLMEDTAGYHKSLYTAMNADAIAQHFYEQGKADAIKNSMAKSKNVKMNPRQQHKAVKAAGMQYRVVGNTSSDFKIRSNKKK